METVGGSHSFNGDGLSSLVEAGFRGLMYENVSEACYSQTSMIQVVLIRRTADNCFSLGVEHACVQIFRGREYLPSLQTFSHLHAS